MAFTNIIDIIYPIGSLYESTVSTSPATLFGGTWTQIKGACLAATDNTNPESEYAKSGSYSGETIIHEWQLPPHSHQIYLEGWTYDTSDKYYTFIQSIYQFRDTTSYTCGSVGTGDGIDFYNGHGKKQNYFLPYHFGCYMWYRTA